MNILVDWIFIILTSAMAVSSYKRIIRNRYSSVAHFVLLVEYLFLSFPILLNYLFGVPQYKSIPWYKSFLSSMTDPVIAVIYDIYILVSMGLLFWYAIDYDKRKSRYKRYETVQYEGVFKGSFLLIVGVLSPVLYILLTGNILSFLVYGTNSVRGIADYSFVRNLSMLVLISIYAFCRRFFSYPVTKRSLAVLLGYSLVITWISGKRFIIALLLMVYLFFYTKSDLDMKSRKKIERYVPLLFLLLILFSYFYLVVVKPLSDVSFRNVYDMLRVDFGRDDVVKFVIEQELFLDKPILEYRGQTMLSTFLTFVPRAFWPSKPYPHYMYLTSRILGTSIHKLPAGTTPSWFEMCIANFSWFGLLFGAVTIPIFCKFCDKNKNLANQMLTFSFVVVLITQSTDAYVPFMLLILAKHFLKLILGGKRIVFVYRRKR